MKNPTVKKIFACVAVLTVLTGSAQGAYKVEIDDDTYVSGRSQGTTHKFKARQGFVLCGQRK